MGEQATGGQVVVSRREQMLRLAEAYEQATAQCGRVDRRFRIAGHLVALEFAGEALVPYLTPALEHLATEDASEPELRIQAFDSVSTGTSIPLGWDELAALNAGGLPASQAVDGIHASYQRPDSGLSTLDLAAGNAYYWSPKPLNTPYWEVASPFTCIFSWWLRTRGQHFTHSAAVGRADLGRGVLVIGPSGSGKSTTGLACLAAGLGYLSDDYCVTDLAPEPRAMSIYSTAKVTANNLEERLSWGRACLAPTCRPWDEKMVLLPAVHREVLRTFRICALVVPRIVQGRGRCEVRPATAAETFKALSVSTMLQLPGAGRSTFQHLAALAARVPGFVLDIEGAIQQIPPLVDGLIERWE